MTPMITCIVAAMAFLCCAVAAQQTNPAFGPRKIISLLLDLTKVYADEKPVCSSIVVELVNKETIWLEAPILVASSAKDLLSNIPSVPGDNFSMVQGNLFKITVATPQSAGSYSIDVKCKSDSTWGWRVELLARSYDFDVDPEMEYEALKVAGENFEGQIINITPINDANVSADQCSDYQVTCGKHSLGRSIAFSLLASTPNTCPICPLHGDTHPDFESLQYDMRATVKSLDAARMINDVACKRAADANFIPDLEFEKVFKVHGLSMEFSRQLVYETVQRVASSNLGILSRHKAVTSETVREQELRKSRIRTTGIKLLAALAISIITVPVVALICNSMLLCKALMIKLSEAVPYHQHMKEYWLTPSVQTYSPILQRFLAVNILLQVAVYLHNLAIRGYNAHKSQLHIKEQFSGGRFYGRYTCMDVATALKLGSSTTVPHGVEYLDDEPEEE